MPNYSPRASGPDWLAADRVAQLPDTEGVAHFLDQFVARIGRVSSWLVLLLVMLVAADVLFRYIWHVSSVAEQELEWHVLAMITLLGSSYTLQQGEHVRVDIFYQHYSDGIKRWMNVLMPALIVIPTMLFVAYLSTRFVGMSWEVREGSPDPGGLPARYLIKAFVPLGFLLLAIQGVAMTLYGLTQLKQTEHPEHD